MKKIFVLWLTAMMFVACGDDSSSNAGHDFSKDPGTIYRYLDVSQLDANQIVMDYGYCDSDSLGNVYWKPGPRTDLYSIRNDTLLLRRVYEDGDTSDEYEIFTGNNSGIIGNWHETNCEYDYDYDSGETVIDCYASPLVTYLDISNDYAIASAKLNPNYDLMSNDGICYDLYEFGEKLEDLCYAKYDSFANIHGVYSVPDVVVLNDTISITRKSPSSIAVKIGSVEFLYSEAIDVSEDNWTRNRSVSLGGKTCTYSYATIFIPKENCNENGAKALVELEKNSEKMKDEYKQCIEDLHLPQVQTDYTLYKKAAIYRPHTKKRTLFEK